MNTLKPGALPPEQWGGETLTFKNNFHRPDVSYLRISRFPLALFGRFNAPQWAWRVALVIGAIGLGGVVGQAAPQIDGGVALIWPPIGIALAVLLRFGVGVWPGVSPGACLWHSRRADPSGSQP